MSRQIGIQILAQVSDSTPNLDKAWATFPASPRAEGRRAHPDIGGGFFLCQPGLATRLAFFQSQADTVIDRLGQQALQPPFSHQDKVRISHRPSLLQQTAGHGNALWVPPRISHRCQGLRHTLGSSAYHRPLQSTPSGTGHVCAASAGGHADACRTHYTG